MKFLAIRSLRCQFVNEGKGEEHKVVESYWLRRTHVDSSIFEREPGAAKKEVGLCMLLLESSYISILLQETRVSKSTAVDLYVV